MGLAIDRQDNPHRGRPLGGAGGVRQPNHRQQGSSGDECGRDLQRLTARLLACLGKSGSALSPAACFDASTWTSFWTPGSTNASRTSIGTTAARFASTPSTGTAPMMAKCPRPTSIEFLPNALAERSATPARMPPARHRRRLWRRLPAGRCTSERTRTWTFAPSSTVLAVRFIRADLDLPLEEAWPGVLRSKGLFWLATRDERVGPLVTSGESLQPSECRTMVEQRAAGALAGGRDTQGLDSC